MGGLGVELSAFTHMQRAPALHQPPPTLHQMAALSEQHRAALTASYGPSLLQQAAGIGPPAQPQPRMDQLYQMQLQNMAASIAYAAAQQQMPQEGEHTRQAIFLEPSASAMHAAQQAQMDAYRHLFAQWQGQQGLPLAAPGNTLDWQGALPVGAQRGAPHPGYGGAGQLGAASAWEQAPDGGALHQRDLAPLMNMASALTTALMSRAQPANVAPAQPQPGAWPQMVAPEMPSALQQTLSDIYAQQRLPGPQSPTSPQGPHQGFPPGPQGPPRSPRGGPPGGPPQPPPP